MKQFNKDKALKHFSFKNNKNTYIKRISISLSCIILVVAIILFTFAKFESVQEYTLIQGRVADQLKDINIIAVFQGETRVDNIPTRDSGYKFKKAECTNGTAEWNLIDWSLNVKATSKTKCSIYFTQVSQTAVEYINSIASSDSSLTADTSAQLNIRYIGANLNNYILFNNELWRIIGVMNSVRTDAGQTKSLLKIIRNESLGAYSWDSSETSVNEGYGVNQWGVADYYCGSAIMTELNTDYLGDVQVGTDGNWFYGVNYAKTKAMPTTTIDSSSQSLIQQIMWYLGSPSVYINGTRDSSWTTNIRPYISYSRERGSSTGKVCTSGTTCNDEISRTYAWVGKVGLMYPSDYGFATSGGSTTDRDTCLNTSMYEWSNVTDCKNNNWLFESKNMWTMSPLAHQSSSRGVFLLTNNGIINADVAAEKNEIKPVVFLKSNVSFTGGTGTQEDPYTLG